MKTIAPNDLEKLIAGPNQLQILDVRTPAEFTSVHVPQAENLPLDSLKPAELYQNGRLTREAPVYLLCQAGGRATKAAQAFAQEGFENTVVVEGGTTAWVNAGLPVSRGRVTISLERQVRIGAGSLVLLGVILGWLVHPYFVALSAFVGSGLVFAGITDWCGMGLLLAKAPWNQRQG